MVLKVIKKLIFILLLYSINTYPQDYKTFYNSNENFEYSIDYPKDCEIIKTERAVKFILTQSNKSKSKGNIIIIVNNISPFKDFEEFEKFWLKGISSNLEDFELIVEGRIMVDNKVGFYYVYKGKDNGRLLKYKRYSIDNSPNIYEIIYETDERKFDSNVDLFDEIVNTIKIKK